MVLHSSPTYTNSFPNTTHTVPPPPKLQDIPPMKQEVEWAVSSQEKKQWLELFRATDDDGDGFVTGVQARNLFSSSGLPLPVLSQIWYVLNTLNHYC